MQTSQAVFTYTLTNGSFTISQSTMALYSVEIILITGSATVTGSLKAGSVASNALNLQANVPISIVANGTNLLPLDGITINASSGTVQIIGQ